MAMTRAQLEEILLKDLQRRFPYEGKKPSSFGLPEPTEHMSELQAHKLKFSAERGHADLRTLQRLTPLNDEQRDVFDAIARAASAQGIERRGTFFFLNANACCGKTTLARHLAAYFRSEGRVVLICASTALASQNYPNEGTTAHYLFHLPVIDEETIDLADEEPIRCLLGAMPERLKLVEAASIIIWDEFPSNERDCFEAVYNSDCLPQFKGKVVVCLGDFKQILPVGKDQQGVLNATISSSPYWHLFTVLRLTINMRLQNPSLSVEEKELQQRYANLLEDVGNNREGEDVCFFQEHESGDYKEMAFSTIKTFNEDDDQVSDPLVDIIEWLYPGGVYDPAVAVKTTILAGRNKQGKLFLKYPASV